jgi:hypothetical protein
MINAPIGTAPVTNKVLFLSTLRDLLPEKIGRMLRYADITIASPWGIQISIHRDFFEDVPHPIILRIDPHTETYETLAAKILLLA